MEFLVFFSKYKNYIYFVLAVALALTAFFLFIPRSSIENVEVASLNSSTRILLVSTSSPSKVHVRLVNKEDTNEIYYAVDDRDITLQQFEKQDGNVIRVGNRYLHTITFDGLRENSNYTAQIFENDQFFPSERVDVSVGRFDVSAAVPNPVYGKVYSEDVEEAVVLLRSDDFTGIGYINEDSYSIAMDNNFVREDLELELIYKQDNETKTFSQKIDPNTLAPVAPIVLSEEVFLNVSEDEPEIEQEDLIFEIPNIETIEVAEEGKLSYNLIRGWNLISFPINEESMLASEVYAKLFNENAKITHIVKFGTGRFEIYSIRKDEFDRQVLYGEDFEIFRGEGFFVKLDEESAQFNLPTEYKLEDITHNLFPGWNILGFGSSDILLADSREVLKILNQNGVEVNTISEWVGGNYNSVVYQAEQIYGNGFMFDSNKGYWVRAEIDGQTKLKLN